MSPFDAEGSESEASAAGLRGLFLLRTGGSRECGLGARHKKGRLIHAPGRGDRSEGKDTRRKIVDERVPVGAKTFTIESPEASQEENAPHPALSRSTGRGKQGDSTGGLKVGDQIM